MIAKLRGTVEELRPTEVLIQVGGVGYHCLIPLSTFVNLKEGENAELFVHTHHKEDQFRLFGFFTRAERSLFVLLISITGIGPSLALSIISGISLEELVEAVRRSSVEILTRIPGIGKNKAEKLLFELSRRMKKIEQFTTSEVSSAAMLRNEAVEALVSLGFDEVKSGRTVDELLKGADAVGLEPLLKAALKRLSS